MDRNLMFIFINHYLFSHPMTIQVLESEQDITI